MVGVARGQWGWLSAHAADDRAAHARQREAHAQATWGTVSQWGAHGDAPQCSQSELSRKKNRTNIFFKINGNGG